MCRLSHQNKSWCHQSIIWWHPSKGFQMMTITPALKGYKRKMHKRVGVPSLRFWVQRAKLTSSRVLQWISVLGWPGISTFRWNNVFGSLFYHSLALLINWASVFINLHYWSDCQFSVLNYKGWSTWKQDCLPSTVLIETSRNQFGRILPLIFPLHGGSFVASLGWLKRAGKSKLHFNYLYLEGLYRCNGSELSLKLTGILCSYPSLSCSQGKHLLGALILLWGNSVYDHEG